MIKSILKSRLTLNLTKNWTKDKFNYIKKTSQGQLLELQLLESRLLDTFFRNLDCSTEKSRLLESGLT